MRRRLDERLALAQGAFYLATGRWPILHLRSFEVLAAGSAAAAIGAVTSIMVE